jgi:mRNA degradation ribonuclease J1/J2
MSGEITTYIQQLDRSGLFVSYIAGLQKRGIGPNMTVVRHRVKRGGTLVDFNLGIDDGIGFGNSDGGFSGFMVHPRILSPLLSPDGRTVIEDALLPLDALLITHDHADHYLGRIYKILHNHNNHMPVILAPKPVRHKLIDEAKKSGVPEDLIIRYFGTHDAPPPRDHFIELEPYKPFKIEGLDILPVCLPHSSYLSLSYLVKAPNGSVYLHLSDFKSDMSIYPDSKDPYGLESVPQLFNHPAVKTFMNGAKLGLVGIESTNAPNTTPITTEEECYQYLLGVAEAEQKRLVCFVLGGNQPRYRTLARVAKNTNRLIEVVGEANKTTVRMLERLGVPWLNVRDIAGGRMVFNGTKSFATQYGENPGGVLTVASGPNGEYIANLSSALDERIDKKLKLDPKRDVIVLTASVIPGNEARVLELIGKALRKGFTVHMPPLSEGAKPEHKEVFATLNRMKNLVVSTKIHSSGHDDGNALAELACACPDSPYFAVIHGATTQRKSLFSMLQNLGRHVVHDLHNGCTVRVPDPRQTVRHTMKAIHEYGQDVFLTYERGAGFGQESATRFGSHAVTEEGIRLKSLASRSATPAQVLTVTIEGPVTDNVQLVFPGTGPFTYEARKEVKPIRTRKSGPKKPRIQVPEAA